MNESLDDLREQINVIDAEIVELLNKRFWCVHSIGLLKKALGQPIKQPEREKHVVDNLLKLSSGDIPEEILSSIYHLILSASTAMQEDLSA